jgi:hypothetical protein
VPYLAGLITPQDYGALGNGVHDDTSAIQQAINAAQVAGGQIVFFPPGTYMVTPVSSTSAALVLNNGSTGYYGVRLVGSSEQGSSIKRLAAGPIITMSGPASDTTGVTHCRYCTIESLVLNGGNLTGTMVQAYYADTLAFRDVLFENSADVAFDCAEFWDSRFYNCLWGSCGSVTGGTTAPNLWLRNSAATSGFGYSTSTVNNIYFVNCRWEQYLTGAIRIERGLGTNSGQPYSLYFVNSKLETALVNGGGPSMFVDVTARDIHVQNAHVYMGGFYSGWSTAQDGITFGPQFGSLRDILIFNATATACIANGVTLNAPLANSFLIAESVRGSYTGGAAPTGAHISFGTSTGEFRVMDCQCDNGTQYGGAIQGSGTEFILTNGNAAGTMTINNSTAVTSANEADLVVIGASTASNAFGMQVTGDTDLRFVQNTKGDATYGGGTSQDYTSLRATTGVHAFSKSLQIGSNTDIGSNGVGVLKLVNATTVPTTNATGGGVAYARNGAGWYRDPNGVVSALVSPSEFSTSPTGCLAETFPRCLGCSATTTQAIGATTGTVYMMGVWLPAGLTITNLNWIVGGTSAVSPTHWWMGIANSAGLQQAATADQLTAVITQGTLKTVALTATYTTTATGLYYLLLSVTATTNPTATGLPVPIPNMNLATPVLAGVSATTQSAPGTSGTTTYTAPASAGGIPYVYLT